MSVLARLDDLRTACLTRRETACGIFDGLLRGLPIPSTTAAMRAAAPTQAETYLQSVGEHAPEHFLRTSNEETNAWAYVSGALRTEYVPAELLPRAVRLLDTITLAHEQLGTPLTRYYDQPRPLRPATIMRLLYEDLAERQRIARSQRCRRTVEITTAVRLLLGQGRVWQEYAHQDVPGHLRAMLAFEHAQWRLLKHRHLEGTERLEAVLALQAEALTNPLVDYYHAALGELTGSDD